MTSFCEEGEVDMDIFSSDDDQLKELLCVTPPPELENGDLFQDLADFIESDGSEGKHSPMYDYLSDSDNSIDVENVCNPVFDIKGSAGEDELVSYLTSPKKKEDQKDCQAFKAKNIVGPCKDGRSDKLPVIKIIEDRSLVEKRVTPALNNGILRVGSNNIKVFKTVKVVGERCNPGQVRSNIPNTRVPSPTDSVTSSTSTQCKSKSAIAAKENREKKKQYIATLETSVKGLSSQNKSLKGQVGQLDSEVETLRMEVEYLRSVLANQSTLSRLLQNIPGVSSVSLRSSDEITCQMKVKSKKRERSEGVVENCDSFSNNGGETKKKKLGDHDYASNSVVVSHSISDSRKKLGSSTPALSGGICLHVADEEVSLEFCAECSRKATLSKSKVK